MNTDKHHVVIIGGGFGGLYAAHSLRSTGVNITLIDRRNFHLFQPLLYQVATDSLGENDAASGLVRFYGQWELLGRGSDNPGFLVFKGEPVTFCFLLKTLKKEVPYFPFSPIFHHTEIFTIPECGKIFNHLF